MKCKACSSFSMVPMEVNVDEEDLLVDQESRFYSCHVCGDNWLSLKQESVDGGCQITFIHNMGMSPVLKRVAHMQTHIVLQDSTVDRWAYFVDDDEITEQKWKSRLTRRRRILRSVCSN